MNLGHLELNVVTALPADRVGLLILRSLTEGESVRPIGGDCSGLLSMLTTWWEPATQEDELHGLRCVEEGFSWLYRHGVLAHAPGPPSRRFFITRAGYDLLDEGDRGLGRLRAAERLDIDLHPAIAQRVRSMYLLGEVDAAAFVAMRQVEITVRDRSGAGPDDFGVDLMRRAFNADTGPLRDRTLPRGEQTGTMELFAGAIGAFKNPSSHRQVDFKDPTLASEVILLADLLLRLLDRTPTDR